MNIPCRICGNSTENLEWIVHEMHFGTHEAFHYFQCKQCNCLQIAEIPGDMSRFYPDEYYSTKPINEVEYSGLRGYFKLLPLKASLFPNTPFRWIISKIAPDQHFRSLRGLGMDTTMRILDVGCGNGERFLYPLRKMGFQTLAGCDPFISDAMQYSNGLRIYKKTITEMSGTSACGWDLVIFHHSFEHIPNPKETLRCVFRLLNRDGICVIRIPTCSSLAWERYSVNWVQLDAPRHLFLYSRESMGYLANLEGFEVTRVEYDSWHFQFWGSENCMKGIPLKDQWKRKGILWRVKRWKLNRRARKLNREQRGDQAVFMLVKKNWESQPDMKENVKSARTPFP